MPDDYRQVYRQEDNSIVAASVGFDSLFSLSSGTMSMAAFLLVLRRAPGRAPEVAHATVPPNC